VTQRTDFISAYLAHMSGTESPAVFHRWAGLSLLGAWLGRRYWMPFGHSRINSNIYCMLMGDAGTRKSTAIKPAASLLKAAGFSNVAAARTTKEKFLMDLAGEESIDSTEDIMEKNLFGEAAAGDAEILVAADEFNTFVGNGNIEFLSLLGVLWDHDGPFEDRKKNSKSFIIQDPVVSILAGNTPRGFSLAFPIEAIGQGIFSRLILVHGERTGVKITWPKIPSEEDTKLILDILYAIRQVASGKAEWSKDATDAADAIYKSWEALPDVRFESYSNRRFTHLLKLCLICSAAALRNTVELEDVIYANTILTHTEHTMPKALGEFGKAKNSDIAHKVLSYLEGKQTLATKKEIWMQVHNDLDNLNQLNDLLTALLLADKVISIKGGYLAKRKRLEEVSSKYVDFSLLTQEEREFIA